MQSSCRRILFGLILVLFTAGGCGPADVDRSAEVIDPAAIHEAILDVLDQQVAAWNDGNIRAFMEGYAQSDSLRFASGGNVRYGWDGTLQRYQESYADEGTMGTLSFDELDIRVLAPDHALVFGRWHLTRSESYANVGGLFTLLFERRTEGWRIVHDHTSAAEDITENSEETSDTLASEPNDGQPDE